MSELFKFDCKGAKDPTCAEGNEYLAEDRIMSHYAFIKENSSYYLTYLPNCKAITDAPDSLLILMK